MEKQITISLSEVQLADTISVLDVRLNGLEKTLAETYSGVDRLLIESVIVHTKALLAHYQQFVSNRASEPAETEYADEVGI